MPGTVAVVGRGAGSWQPGDRVAVVATPQGPGPPWRARSPDTRENQPAGYRTSMTTSPLEPMAGAALNG
jgi:hypothetical protein